MKKQAAPEEQGEKAPLWIISFADMISLLMAFFVMLLTMATPRSGLIANEGEGIFEATIYGFKKAIDGYGVPTLFGGKPDQHGTPSDALYFDSHKTYYPISGGNETDGRTIDASEERLRRVFDRIGKNAKTYKSDLQWGQPDFVVTPITFNQGQFLLNEPAKQFLTKWTSDLQESGTEKLKLYVVGLASEEKNEKQQWILSTKRAQAAADFIRSRLSAGNRCSVYSWGTGSGSNWVMQDSSFSAKSPIFIGVVRDDQP